MNPAASGRVETFVFSKFRKTKRCNFMLLQNYIKAKYRENTVNQNTEITHRSIQGRKEIREYKKEKPLQQ